MNCLNHPDSTAVAYCRHCGIALCEECRRSVEGVIYCEAHLPAHQPSPPAPYGGTEQQSPVIRTSPGTAFVLGFIPGVGAIYNGQYAKGLIHVIILGLLISIVGSGAGGLEALFGLLIALMFFYMAFEAYHTARKRQLGEPVDEFSSLVPFRAGRSKIHGPVALIAIGVLFLLNTMDILRFYQILRYWPIALIFLGGYMLFVRLSESRGHGVEKQQGEES